MEFCRSDVRNSRFVSSRWISIEQASSGAFSTSVLRPTADQASDPVNDVANPSLEHEKFFV